MNPIIKKIVANFLLIVIAACVGFGTYHLGTNSDTAIFAAVAAVIVAKLDEMRIVRARARNSA